MRSIYGLSVITSLTLTYMVGCTARKFEAQNDQLAQNGSTTSSTGSGSQVPMPSPAASLTPAPTLTYRLSFPSQGANCLGVTLTPNLSGASVVVMKQPAQLLIKTIGASDGAGSPVSYSTCYQNVTQQGNNWIAHATVTTPNGSAVDFSDTFIVLDDGRSFTVDRMVEVSKAAVEDIGFNSRFSIGFASPGTLSDYHFLAPGLWYDQNTNPLSGAPAVSSGAIASDANAGFIYFREVRSTLPFVMMQDNASGTALCLAHANPNSSSGSDESSSAWLVDGSVQYAALGAHTSPSVELALVYPAMEGEINYIDRSNAWVKRSHPMAVGQSHTYQINLHMEQQVNASGTANFNAALADVYRYEYALFTPQVRTVNLDTSLKDGVGLLSYYSAPRGPLNAQGLPFQVNLIDGSVSPGYVSYQMGFVGEQIPAGFQLLRDGVLNGHATTLNQGVATLDFWAQYAFRNSALPMQWFNVDPATFRNDACHFPLFLRIAADGMEGELDAARFMRQHGQPKLQWERFVTAFGDWLVANQNADGSWYRAYNPDGSVFTSAPGCDAAADGDDKLSTTHPIRFLVALYFSSGDASYLKAALAAGNFSFGQIYQTGMYVGGPADNPATLDKEAGMMALHAFLALYDATHDPKWLDAAKGAAYFTETFSYAWDYAISSERRAVQFAGNAGRSLISTGFSGTDIYLGFAAFDLYRLHLLSDTADSHFLNVARSFSYNTKLSTQMSDSSVPDYRYPIAGLVGEADDLSNMADLSPIPQSAAVWLPWLTLSEIESLQKLQDTFGSTSVDAIETTPLATRKAQNANVYAAAGSLGWSGALAPIDAGFEAMSSSDNPVPGWSAWTPDNGASSDAMFVETFGNSHAGASHLALFKQAPFTVSAYQDFQGPAGSYTIGAWVECSGNIADAHMEVHNYATPDVFTKTPACLTGSVYHYIQTSITSSTGHFTVGFYANDTVGGQWLRVDDVAVVSNPGFEAATSSTLQGWRIWTADNGASASAAFIETATPSHGGLGHLAEYRATPYELSAYQDIALSNGPHTVSAWVQCSGGQNDAHMELHNYQTPDQFTKVNACLGASGYQQIVATVVVQTGMLTVGFYSLDQVGGHWLRVDDVNIQ